MRKTIIAIALASISIPVSADFTLAKENRNSPLSILPYGKAVAVSTDPGKTLVIEKQGLDDSGRQIIQETSYNQSLQEVLQSEAVVYGIQHDGQQWSIETQGHSERVNAYTKGSIDSVQEGWSKGLISFRPIDSPVFELPLIQSGFAFANRIVLGNTDYKVSAEAQKILDASSRKSESQEKNRDKGNDAWDRLQKGLHNKEVRNSLFSS